MRRAGRRRRRPARVPRGRRPAKCRPVQQDRTGCPRSSTGYGVRSCHRLSSAPPPRKRDDFGSDPSALPINGPYGAQVEIRQIEAFVAVAEQLHFGRAAEQMRIGQPALSELVQRLERELGTPLFARTTRRVALTPAGEELLPRARSILDDVTSAKTAVRRVAQGEGGTLRLGITPPVAPVLAPYLTQQFAARAPLVAITVQQLWLPMMTQLVAAGQIDVGITCGLTLAQPGSIHASFCAQPLLVAVRPEHRLASAAGIALAGLAGDTLGMSRDSLFPAWALSQRQALAKAGIEPRIVHLDDTDI